MFKGTETGTKEIRGKQTDRETDRNQKEGLRERERERERGGRGGGGKQTERTEKRGIE